MDPNTPTFLVTGASGFIGTWVLRELLRRNFKVIAYDLQDGGRRWEQLLGPSAGGVRLVQGDLLDSKKLGGIFDHHAITHVIHLGALLTPECQENPFRGCEINVLGTMRVFEEIRSRRTQIQGLAYASSIAVYGQENDHSIAPSEKNSALEPQTFYGVFKRTTEMIAEQYWRHFGVPSIGLRPYVVYGPGREHGLTAGPTLAARVVARGGSYVFGFCGAAGFEFVEDTALAFVRSALEGPQAALVTNLPGKQATVEEVIDQFEIIRPGVRARLSIAGPPLPCTISPKSFTIRDLFPDWQGTSLAEGIRRTVEFYESSESLR